jgi:hypothetical protein
MHSGCWDFWSPWIPERRNRLPLTLSEVSRRPVHFRGFPRSVRPCGDALGPVGGGLCENHTSISPPAGKIYKLRKEFHDCTAQCCDMIPWRLILPVCPHLSRCRFGDGTHLLASERLFRIQSGHPIRGVVRQRWSLWIVGRWLSFLSRH